MRWPLITFFQCTRRTKGVHCVDNVNRFRILSFTNNLKILFVKKGAQGSIQTRNFDFISPSVLSTSTRNDPLGPV